MPTHFRIDVFERVAQPESLGKGFLASAHQLGIEGLENCHPSRLYFVQGELNQAQVTEIAQELLADPVTERFEVHNGRSTTPPPSAATHHIDVTYLPGVTDPAAENLAQTAQRLGYPVTRAATGRSFALTGQLTSQELTKLADMVFSNPVVQQNSIDTPIQPPFIEPTLSDGFVEQIPLTEATPKELEQISQERRLSMNLEEMQAIQTYYRSEGREPTDVELEMLAQTWSEHCVHKTFKAIIQYAGPDGKTEVVDGLLDTYLRAATDAIAKPWVKSAFVDNAGIVAYTDQFDLAFKVETHNHPSALEPFGGANTGIGGVIRDVIGVSARPIASTDVLCFGEQTLPAADLPEGVLHPRRIQAGVIDGIEDYGNKMGIPTVNGAILYAAGYTANPLVYCGSLGILPVGSHPSAAQAGDVIVALGGRTGRDGLRGATFSSMEMDTSTSEIAGTAVQIGHPIQEKQVLEVILRARDEQLYTAITDCGAGGFSSAVGEMSEKLGARVQLQNIRLKYPGLRPWEIWLSEAQERMVLAVPQNKMARLQEICAGQDVEATVLGEFTGDHHLRIYYGDQLVGDLAETFLHDGLPQRQMEAFWSPEPRAAAEGAPYTAEETLIALLQHPNIRSKEDTIRKYDHEVMAGTAVKPLVGVYNHGPSDGTVLVPLDAQMAHVTQNAPLKGAALSNGICPQFSALDPYHMAWAAIDEALRNAVAVGADPDQIAILDNFCWGNPSLPDRLGALVRCAQGCYDAAMTYGTPYVSGKDSLYNEYTGADGEKHAIPGTLLISALGIVPDVEKAMTMDFKAAEELVYVIGETRYELAGSHFEMVTGAMLAESRLPQAQPQAMPILRAVHATIAAGLPTAVHDCSEGGLAVALAEMALAGKLGATLSLKELPLGGALSDQAQLFAESLSRFVMTVPAAQQAEFEALLDKFDIPYGQIGETGGQRLTMSSTAGAQLLDLPVNTLDNAFRGHIGVSQLDPLPEPTTANFTTHIQASGPKVLILHANGSNRDRDAALACQLAGGRPEIVHINQLLANERHLSDFGMLVIPGGFSYGDDLGAGVLWASNLRHLLGARLEKFVSSGKPVLGICNGFQVLVKSGLLEVNGAGLGSAAERPFTLTYNENHHFECRWTVLQPHSDSRSLFTRDLSDPIHCPVAHGEGRFMVHDKSILNALKRENRIAVSYVGSGYPANPNGSVANIAGICNRAGNVMGLMPHPEDHIFPWQHPHYQRGFQGNSGLALFVNGVKHA